MKKSISVLLAAGLAMTQCNFVFADDTMENALISVKNKISIPENLTEFETSESDSGIKQYSFEWSDEKHDNSISVGADSDGHILNYSRYDSSWYKDDSALKIDNDFSITELETYSTTELKKMVPELFSSESDCLVLIPYQHPLSLDSRSHYSFNYIRKHNGIEVKNNQASVSVMKTENGFEVNSADISWDYTTEFIDAENILDAASAENILSEKYPMQLAYRKFNNDKYFLEYTSDGAHYISAQSGEEISEDKTNDIMPLMNQKAEASYDAAMSGGGSRSLTPAECAELEKVNGLKSADELLQKLYSMSELGIKKPSDDNKIHTYTYKIDDKYITSISIEEENKQSDEKQYVPNSSVNATFDAQTGELKSYYAYGADLYRNDNEEEDFSGAQDKARAFLTKYYNDKLTQCKADNASEKSSSITYVRQVNDIPYIDNYITASWNNKTNRIESFACNWDDDISKLPAPSEIISLGDATQNMFAKYPVKSLYIRSNGKYTQCYTNSEYSVKIDAFSGKIVNYDGTEINERHSGQYSDTDGHWVEKIAKKLAEYGIVIDGNELRPDEKITQAEFLKLVYSGVCGHYLPSDNDFLYRRLISQKVLSDEEINSDSPLTRENSIRYLLRAIGIKEVAEIQGIYICDFKDADQISADKLGYCAIAKGFGIVNGSDGYLYPQNNITRAEALAMIYNYLTR